MFLNSLLVSSSTTLFGSKPIHLKVALSGYLAAVDVSQANTLKVCRAVNEEMLPRPCEQFQRLAMNNPRLFHNFKQIVKTRVQDRTLQTLLLDHSENTGKPTEHVQEEVISSVYVLEGFGGNPMVSGKRSEVGPLGNDTPIVPDSSRQNNNSEFGRIAGGISTKTKGRKKPSKDEEFDFSVGMFEVGPRREEERSQGNNSESEERRL